MEKEGEMEILVREKCSECKGEGIVQHPVWAEFWREHANQSPTIEETEHWFRDRGHILHRRGHECLPEEEISCTCDDGYIESWVAPEQVLRAWTAIA
jgi:hypothetical protein